MAGYEGKHSNIHDLSKGSEDLPVTPPGKRTLVEEEHAKIQRRAQISATTDPAAVHAAAAEGVATPSSPLPHLDTIQRAFGGHDVSGLQAHTGPEAIASARAMGADAYATANHVVLGDRADLHTVAHEAAHVVQQRGGVQLKGGVGEAGDHYEQHADAVADRVVAGESAEDLLPPVSGSGSGGGALGVQRLAKIKAVNRRTALDLALLTDEELAQLVAQLDGGAQAFEITYDREENADQLLARARAKLNSRQQVTGSFNVRGRAVTSTGVVFSDDATLRARAEHNDIAAYPTENEALVRQEYAAVFATFRAQPLAEHPQLGKFYGPVMLLRGPRANAAEPTGKEKVLYAPQATVVSTLVLTDVCKRGDESASRDGAMGGLSARNYAKAVMGNEALNHSWEWLHLVGSAIGGGNQLGNLVAGTFDTNTLMIPLEQTIVEYAAKNRPTAQNPMTITATAQLHREQASGRNTWLAENIRLQVQHGSNNFWLGPIGQKTDQLTQMEFDFYHYLFQRMANV